MRDAVSRKIQSCNRTEVIGNTAKPHGYQRPIIPKDNDKIAVSFLPGSGLAIVYFSLGNYRIECQVFSSFYYNGPFGV